MRALNLTPIIFLFTLSSCFTQPSAPIEYYGNTYSKQANENRIKYNSVTEDFIPEQESIHSIKFKAKGNLTTVTFQEGDSLAQIASDYTVSEKALSVANRLSSMEKVSPGRKLVIPKVVTHKVQEDEDIEIIAENYHQDLNILTELNNLKPPFKVFTGDILEIIVEPELRLEANHHIALRNIDKAELPKLEDKVVTLIPKKAPKFMMPATGAVKTKFRAAEGVKNEGIIIAAEFRAPVKAIADGQVTFSGNKPDSFGNFIIITHADNTLSAYAHLNDLIVNKFQKVKKGDVIGHVGKSGNAREAELYFALKVDNKPVDPLNYMSGE